MDSLQSSSESCTSDISKKGSTEAITYEKLILTLLAKRGYELSKDTNSEFRNFAIGLEVGLVKDVKFDDIVFKYEDKDNKNNVIFVQIKYKMHPYQIDSRVLSYEASRAEGGEYGGFRRDFNLQKYFISYLNVRDELSRTKSKELENANIKYVAILTNVGLDTEELNDSGFSLKEAPDDIANLFLEPLPEKDNSNQCYQFDNVSEDLCKIFKRSSDLHRLARELAKYVVFNNYRKTNILGIHGAPMRYYHVALVNEVIEKVKNDSPKMTDKTNEVFSEAKFKDDFLNNNETGPKKELRDTILEAMRELDISKRNNSDDELIDILRGVNLKVVSKFGKGRYGKMNLPDKWVKIEDDDIADFLKHLVFLVNLPNVIDIHRHIHRGTAFSHGSYVRSTLDQILPIFRYWIEKEFEIHGKIPFKEKWVSSEQIDQLVREILKKEYDICRDNLMKAYEVMCNTSNKLGKLESSLESFLEYVKSREIAEDVPKPFKAFKTFCVSTPLTHLTAVKVVEYLNITNFKIQFQYIPIEMDNLKYEMVANLVKEVFGRKKHNLLIIECRQTNKQIVKKTCDMLFNKIISNHCQRIILIAMKNVLEMFKRDSIISLEGQHDSDKPFIEETDDIYLDDFKPKENPLEKKVIVFQGQEEKVCIATLTNICNWNHFINYLIGERFLGEQDVIELMLIILGNDSVEIGSQPLRTSSLEGAYAILFEEINIETLANKLLLLGFDKNNYSLEDPPIEFFQLYSQGIDNNNDIYIIDGIKGSSKEEKIDNLVQYLDLVKKEEIKNLCGDIGSECKIQIADGEINDDDFKRVCFNKPEKRIFCIDIKHEGNERKFILRQLYNPKFYLKRNFKQVTDMKEVKEHLMNKCLSEIFIFCCTEVVLIDSLEFSDESEKELFKNKCKNGNIIFSSEETDAKAKFYRYYKRNKIVHFFKLINKELTEVLFIKEHNLVKNIKSKKVVIIAGEAGMGKTTTLTKLYESFIETHWVIRINLKYHIQSIREINLVNGNIDTVSVVNFLSSINTKLNNNLAKSLLAVALNKKENFLTPLLLVFDGFDEILYEDVRNNMLLLLKFLKEESAAKLWITTSLQYKKILENELSTFAIEFDPMDDDFKEAYVTQYLKDRLYLSEKKITDLFLPENGILFVKQCLEDHLHLSKTKIAELFVQNNENKKKVQMYIEKLLDRMKLVFASNISRLIGTPLQLYLVLDGSIRHFKKWIEKEQVENLTFNYLGEDPCEVYERFIDRKYEFYFQKTDIRDCLRQKANKFIFDQYSEDLAMSLILGVEPKNSLEEFKDTVLSSGIIESDGNNTEFIHTTFRDYFAAKVFVQWIKKRPSAVSNSFKKEYILKEILRKPDYSLIRCFMNINLSCVVETKKFEECLKHYGMVIEKLLLEKESRLIDEKGTPLHVAVTENNKNIVRFLLESLKRNVNILQNFLFISDKDERTALHVAVEEGNTDIVCFMLNSLEGHIDVLKKFLLATDKDGRTALHVAVEEGNKDIVYYIINSLKGHIDVLKNLFISLLNIARSRNDTEIVELLSVCSRSFESYS